MTDHDPIPEAEGGSTAAQGHGSGLAEELRELLEPAAPPAPTQPDVLDAYLARGGEMPPTYEAPKDVPLVSQAETIPTVEAPVEAESNPERESDSVWYGASASPVAESRLGSRDSEEEATEPELVEEPVVEETPEAEISEEDEQNLRQRDLIKNNALMTVDGIKSEILREIGKIGNLAEDLRQDRRDVVTRLGGRFLEQLRAHPGLRDDEYTRRRVREMMEELVDNPRGFETSPQARKSFEDRLQDQKEGVTTNLDRIAVTTYGGDLTAPKREGHVVPDALQGVSRVLSDTLTIDDEVRSVYVRKLNAILELTDPTNRRPSSPDGYSESGKLIERMKKSLMSREGKASDPDEFRGHWDQSRRGMQRSYEEVVRKCDAAPAEKAAA